MAVIRAGISSISVHGHATTSSSLPRGDRRALQRRLTPKFTHPSLPRKLRRSLARSLTGTALLLALAQSVEAATITVTTNIPAINDGDNQCSLIEAIINANNAAATHPDCVAGDGTDTIVLPTNTTITLSSNFADYQGDTALPVITSNITIQGNGTAIVRNKKSKTPGRLVAVSASGSLRLESLTLSGGNQNQGGAVFNTGSLSLVASTISGNKATDGGGIYNAGGGILEVENSLITRNVAVYYGGGIFDCGSFSMTNSMVSANTAGSMGGGITHLAKIHAPYASIFPRLPGCYGSLGATIITSTIYGNRAAGGGGLANEQGGLLISNSTISGNTATGSGGGLLNAQYSGTAIENCTITDNAVTGTPSRRFSQGGGISNGSFALLDLRRSIISGNKASTGAEVKNSIVGTVRLFDVNLFGVNGNSGVYGFFPVTIVPAAGVKLKNILSPLADNGGPTLTHALAPGSPAIDAAPADADCPATDQRGNTRPQGGGCDIGAFEK